MSGPSKRVPMMRLARLNEQTLRGRWVRHLPIVDHRALIEVVSIRDIYRSVRAELEHAVSKREAFLFAAGQL